MKTSVKKFLGNFIAVLAIGLALCHVPNAFADEKSKSLLQMLTGNSETKSFLPPDAAFQLKLTALDHKNIQAAFIVAPEYYLYRQRIKFELKTPNTGKIEQISLPSGEIKKDPNFGEQEVYHHSFNANLKLAIADEREVVIAATYQGCSEEGLCYAPINKIFTIQLDATGPKPAINTASSADGSVNTSDGEAARLLKTGNIWLIIAGFFGAGLLLSLTPCVLPMIPILSSIIVGKQSPTSGRLHSFALSAAYVLGMSLSYTLAGIAAGLSGDLISQSLQSPWVLGIFAFIFVLLACSMFGFYELQLPGILESRLIKLSNQFKGGQFLGVFIMGVLSALIVSPCVAAPLAGALLYIGQSHDVILGGTALFALSVGMGVPLLLIGASAGQILPKTGNWMNAVRNFFGVVMLGMAIWLITPVIPTGVQLALWAALSIVTAVYLKALDTLPPHTSSFAKFWKGIAIILLVFGIALFIGALSGAKSALQPLSNFTTLSASQARSTSPLAFTRIKTATELEQALARAKGQAVMLDFYADWCVSCKELEQFTFTDSNVQRLLKNTTLLQADVTAGSDESKALLKRFGLFGPPGIVFFNPTGQEMASLRTVGFQNAEHFVGTLTKRDQCIASTRQC